MPVAAGDARLARMRIAHPPAGCQEPGSRSRRPPGRVQWLVVPDSVSTTRVAGAGLLRDPRLGCYRASGASISRAAARIEKCPWRG